MKNSIKTFFLFLSCMALFSCSSGKPLSKVPSDNNATYNVSYLFEHDGCKVYRFHDNGHYVYFTNCNGEAISIENDSVQTRIINTTKVKN